MAWWRSAQRQCCERMSRYLLGNSMHIEAATFLYGLVSPGGRAHGFEDLGVKGLSTYHHWQGLTGWLCNPHNYLPGDLSMECHLHQEGTLPWRIQVVLLNIPQLLPDTWSTRWDTQQTMMLLTLTRCPHPKDSPQWYFTCLPSVPVQISRLDLGFFYLLVF